MNMQTAYCELQILKWSHKLRLWLNFAVPSQDRELLLPTEEFHDPIVIFSCEFVTLYVAERRHIRT